VTSPLASRRSRWGAGRGAGTDARNGMPPAPCNRPGGEVRTWKGTNMPVLPEKPLKGRIRDNLHEALDALLDAADDMTPADARSVDQAFCALLHLARYYSARKKSFTSFTAAVRVDVLDREPIEVTDADVIDVHPGKGGRR
jgi:hypothetical protein